MISEREFWDSRYRNRDYIYGRMANNYFREQVKKNKPGRLLCLCEGEGRNAVYAAYSGWQVVATDFSEIAKEKAMTLAREKNVSLEYLVCDIVDYNFEKEKFDYVALIHCHFTPQIREEIFRKIIEAVRPGGGIIFEGFSTEQLGRNSGGPSEAEKLYTIEEVKRLLPDFEFEELYQTEFRMNEGLYHIGMANIIRFMAYKPEN